MNTSDKVKLRNKKTGEIVTLDSDHDDSLADFGGKILIETKGREFSYDSLAALNEDWEDYAPKEPLIKNEKIRKAVRAWADANFAYELLVDNNYGFSDYNGKSITFIEASSFHLSAGKTYTIAELCGEEEE